MTTEPRRYAILLSVAVLAGVLAACGERSRPAERRANTIIRVSAPKRGWAESIEYRSGQEGGPTLALNGVRFALRDPAAFLLDWEAVGISGITVTSSFTYESTVPVKDALLSVSGRAVEIRDGVLWWGDIELGPVSEGDVVVVDAEGVHLSR